MTKYAHAILVHACLNKPTTIVGFRTVGFVGIVGLELWALWALWVLKLWVLWALWVLSGVYKALWAAAFGFQSVS